jgi:hypothetical protein
LVAADLGHANLGLEETQNTVFVFNPLCLKSLDEFVIEVLEIKFLLITDDANGTSTWHKQPAK